MTKEEIEKVIIQAQAGDRQSKNQLVRLLQDNKYMSQVRKYLYMNRLVEPDEVRSEFWIGVILALPKVKVKIGDPLHYLAWKGVNKIRQTMARKIGRGVQLLCCDCHYVGRLFKENGEYKCKKCGSTNYETHEREVNLSTLNKPHMQENEDTTPLLDLLGSTKPNQMYAILRLDYEYIKGKLAPREAEVLSLIIEHEIDKEHEENYLTKVGEILGISGQCVWQYIKRIRIKLKDIKEEMK